MLGNMIKKLSILLALTACGAPQTSIDPRGVPRANAAMAAEFIDLTFQTEAGNAIPGILKFQGPIRVSLDASLSDYRRDLESVLGNIRNAARIDIAIGGAGSQIHVQQIPAATMDQHFPNAACVVASGVNSFGGYLRGNSVRWTSQTRLQKSVVLIPDDAPPYIVRACINEEIGQALGPVNDLYYVANTVFNDDNVHTSLTSFDKLMLRVLYDDRLVVGMSREIALPIVQNILQEINPVGNRAGPQAFAHPQWKQLIETAMIGSNPRGRRVAAARQAIEIARGFNDHRLIHSLLVYGRLNLRGAPQIAAPAFQEAYTLSLERLGPQDLRTALATMHIAAIALAAERYDDVLILIGPAIGRAHSYDATVLIAGLEGLRALAYAALGREREAAEAQRESLKYARIAFGADAERIASEQAQIAGLVPAN